MVCAAVAVVVDGGRGGGGAGGGGDQSTSCLPVDKRKENTVCKYNTMSMNSPGQLCLEV